MNVRDLMTVLIGLDPELPVVLCRSPGGDNGFSPLLEAELGMYYAARTWQGEFSPDSDPEYVLGPGSLRAVALYPTY